MISETDEYGLREYCLPCGRGAKRPEAPPSEELEVMWDTRTKTWRKKQRRRAPSHSGAKL